MCYKWGIIDDATTTSEYYGSQEHHDLANRAKYNEPWPRVQGWVWWAMAHTAVQRRSECNEPRIVTLCISNWQQLRCWKNAIASWRDFTGILWHLSIKPSVTETAGKRCHVDVWHARKPSIQVESAHVSATPQNPQLRPARANFPRTPGWALPTHWHRDRDRSRLTLCTGSGSVCAGCTATAHPSLGPRHDMSFAVSCCLTFFFSPWQYTITCWFYHTWFNFSCANYN